MNIHVRKVLPAESQILAELCRKTFYETWHPINTPEDLNTYMSEAFDEEKIKKDLLDFTVNTFLFAYAENELAGYVKLRNDRTHDEFKILRALEMERIYVLKQYQDKKTGKALMDESIRIAKEEKYHWLWLGVNQENHKAINFYKRYRFTIFNTRTFTLGTTIEDDFIMKLAL